MPDPLDLLRTPDTATEPDPAFATWLRAELERALSLPRGVRPMTATPYVAVASGVATARSIPTPAAVPYLAVADARAAIDWYQDVLGARLQDEPIVMPDARIGHAELTISGGVLYLADQHPEIGVVAPRAGEASVSLMLPVGDADAVRARAVAAGATGDRPPYDGYGTRNAWIVDPFGHRWCLQSPLPPGDQNTGGPAYREGDVGYVSLQVPDPDPAVRFYTAAFGWDLVTDDTGRVRSHGSTPALGVFATPGAPNLFCCYVVDDVAAAAARVRAAGGTAGDTEQRPFGALADCVDDQGVAFALYQPAAATGQRPDPGSTDLAYLTLEVVDSGRARAFYGSVLGWQFEPGRVADGWQVVGTVPMVGLSGGHERATAIPMWQVADIADAVELVRAAGGTATEPQRQPYGITSECTDDQGSRFYLGQLRGG